ncbi:hypothetical protein [Actinocorallia longicatena]|uniref:hypothetical protein n=1 Tax=Actinocorallia longicatena TaxID=111803 RepID=UPI0031E225CF
MCQALSRRLRRKITPDELGFTAPAPADLAHGWDTDPLTELAELGGTDLDLGRRHILTNAVYSATALALPDAHWWQTVAALPADTRTRHRVGDADVATVRTLTTAFSRVDQQHGGGHGRKAVVQYLNTEVADLLRGPFATAAVQRAMFTAAGELAYLAGWMAFDNGEHALAQRYFALALKLAARADDPPLSAHILRAMAHQALDLGAPRQALAYSAASVNGPRYINATPRERALIQVVHARALATNGQRQAAATTLVRAETDLTNASDGTPEPDRTFFFGEASLAHETARTLTVLGDAPAAISQFQRSIHKRGTTFRRTHAVTLGYLGATHLAQGNLEAARTAWATALDTLETGIHSARARQTITDMRTLISPYRRRTTALTDLDNRGAAYLAHTR